MAFQSGDRIRETSTTTGTGTLTLAGAATACRAFSAICANNDVIYYCAVDQSGSNWEVGLGTWQTGNLIARTAGNVLSGSSGAGVLVSFTTGTRDVFCTVPSDRIDILNNEKVNVLPVTTTSTPTTPAANTLGFYAKNLAGRTMPHWKDPRGREYAMQTGFGHCSNILYTPMSGTTVSPNGFGIPWTKGGGAGTVSHPNVASTSAATAMRRTRHANAVTTTNQAMGIIATAANVPQYLRGAAANVGGFYFFARFSLGIWLSGCRIFAGMTPGTAECVTSDTLANNSCGLWRITTDTGNSLFFATRDGTTTNLTTITGATVASKALFEVHIWCKPNDTTLYFRVDQPDNGSGTDLGTLIDTSTSTNLPVNTTFLGPQVEMSNGTANTTVNTVAIDINRIYVESER